MNKIYHILFLLVISFGFYLVTGDGSESLLILIVFIYFLFMRNNPETNEVYEG